MKPGRVIQSTFFLMIVIQTIGSIDSKNRLPAPRQFAAIGVLWGILFLAADSAMNKIAARLSVLVVLTGMVIGPFGKVAIGFLNKVATEFAPEMTGINIPIPGFPSIPFIPGKSTVPDDTGAPDIA